MLNHCWTKIDRLLLLSHQDEQLNPILQILGDALPKTTLKLLSLDERVNFKLFAVQKTEMVLQTQGNQLEDLIETIKDCAAAIILTKPNQSPYTLAYLCYLAGIALRIGQSHEFGGGVLSTCITPSVECISLTQYHLHLIEAVGIVKPVLSPNLNLCEF